MKKYKAKFEIYYNTPPKSPRIREFFFEGESDFVAEKIARFRIALSLGRNQSAKILTLTNLSE